LLLSLLVVSLPQTIGSKNTSKTETLPFEKTPLSTSEIKTNWPDLPTAEELWNSEFKYFIDTRSFGKQAVDPQLAKDVPTVEMEIEYEIMNYTSALPNFLTGELMRDVPNIWLQYNDTIWIQVPYTRLGVSNQLVTEKQDSVDTRQSTWAYGIYTNPAQIAGNSDVWGAASIGSWGDYNPSSVSDYIGADVLTVIDNYLIFQIVMAQFYYSYYAVAEIHYHNGSVFGSGYLQVSPTLGQLYNQYIKYHGQNQQWELWWNFINIGNVTDGDWNIWTGNQPNVVFESNDDDEDAFEDYNADIGDIIGGKYWGAILYLFDGAWQPWDLDDPVPNAYAYDGGSSTNVIFTVGNNSPPDWWGEESSGDEQLTVGYDLDQPDHGDQLW
jgi:hypothetical protein